MQVREASRTAVADLSCGGGFIIRRLASPGSVVVQGAAKPLARRVLTPSSNKENVPPVWAAPNRRSPLPEWYPRTPLRDITTIIKAVERRSRLSNAATQPQIQWTEDSSQPVDHTLLTHQETVAASGPGSTQDIASSANSLVEGKLTASSSPSDDCSLQTPSKSNDPVLTDLMEKKLSSSIEQIEKMVRRNLNNTPKATQPSKRAVQRRTLMSMR
ncbi:hypothetical protein ACP4OV_011536 [Aristida adscensionis]